MFRPTRRSLLAMSLALSAPLLPLPAFAEEIETARGKVELAATPKTVVAYDFAAVDTLDALGVEVAGAPDPRLLPYLEHIKPAPVGTLFEPDLEALANLGPDLVIVGGRSAAKLEDVAKVAPAIDMTIGADVPAETRARIATYARLFGKEDKAKELEAAYDAKLAELEAAAKGKGKALLVMANGTKISGFGKGSRFGWIHSILGLPEAHEGFAVEGHGDAISFEFIAETNPDWLIVIDRAQAIGQQEGGGARATLDNDLVNGTKAAKEGHIVYLSPGPIYLASGGYQQMMGTMDELLAALKK